MITDPIGLHSVLLPLLTIIILNLYSADYIAMSKSALQVPKKIIVIIMS